MILVPILQMARREIFQAGFVEGNQGKAQLARTTPPCYPNVGSRTTTNGGRAPAKSQRL
jgi:hypothetical protein